MSTCAISRNMVRSPLDEAVITHRLRELRQDRYFRGGDSGNAMTAETSPASEPYGALAPRVLDRAVIAMTAHMPANWLGRLLANGLRRIVMQRLPEDGGVDVKRWGLRLRLHPRHNGRETGLLFTPQFYEAGERAALAAWIAKARTPGQPFVFVDIGANVGLFSFFVASCAGANARILAIEPESETLPPVALQHRGECRLADPGRKLARLHELGRAITKRSGPPSRMSCWN